MPKVKRQRGSRDTGTGSSATMQDVADELGLSVATVSRALRQVPGINAETRAQVHRAASKLGYRPPQSYRSATPDSDNLTHIGVFVETTQERVSPAYMTGIMDASMSLNISPIIHYVKPGECESILDAKQQPAAMRSGLLSGAILIFWWPLDVVKQLSRMMPIVSVMHNYPGAHIDMVGIDNHGGVELLIRNLYNLGHRRIGYIGRCGSIDWSNVRYGAYASTMSALGLKHRETDIIDVTYDDLVIMESDWTQYAEQAAKLTAKGVTAWVCATEPAGWKIHNGLEQAGFSIPGDVSVTGFHRPNQREPGRPDLTSISASYEAIGAAAIRRIQYRVQNNAEPPRTILFACEDYPGATAGPARKSV